VAWGNLFKCTAKSWQQRLNLIASGPHGASSDQLAVKIVSCGCTAERECRLVALRPSLMECSKPRRTPKDEHEEAGSKWVERAAVSNPWLPCNATNLGDNIVTRRSVRFINEQDPIDARCARASACHG
jgi:hypothetical protein